MKRMTVEELKRELSKYAPECEVHPINGTDTRAPFLSIVHKGDRIGTIEFPKR